LSFYFSDTIEKAKKGLNRSEEESDWQTAVEEELKRDLRRARRKRDDEEYEPENRPANKKMRTKGTVINRLAQPQSIKIRMPSQKGSRNPEGMLKLPELLRGKYDKDILFSHPIRIEESDL